jgi:aldose 1-epimerase
MPVSKKSWGNLPDGREAFIFDLFNHNGITVRLSNYGGLIVSILTPDKNGVIDDIVLGFDTLEEYIPGLAYFGAMIGRFANRISNAEFRLNDKTYKLTQNTGVNHIHGGGGFHKKLWNYCETESGVILSLSSPDGEDGYPGNLRVEVYVSLTDDNHLVLDYSAISDKDTIVSLTNHAYFNLAGKGAILSHQMKINADYYTPVDDAGIPTGDVISVAGTDFDFRTPKTIKSGFYDHNYGLNEGSGAKAEVVDRQSGRYLKLYTTMPGMQFYCGKNIKVGLKGKNGSLYDKYSGLCLETQYFPNSPNVPQFPSPSLNAGVKYHHITVFEFGVAAG